MKYGTYQIGMKPYMEFLFWNLSFAYFEEIKTARLNQLQFFICLLICLIKCLRIRNIVIIIKPNH